MILLVLLAACAPILDYSSHSPIAEEADYVRTVSSYKQLAQAQMVQLGEATSPVQFGISRAQAAQAGLTISSGLTPAFWIYCAFVLALAATCAWMLFWPRRATPAADRAPVGPLSPSLG